MLNEKEFINELKFKFINLINEHGPIVDIVHSNNAYCSVEEIINFCIEYFMIKRDLE